MIFSGVPLLAMTAFCSLTLNRIAPRPVLVIMDSHLFALLPRPWKWSCLASLGLPLTVTSSPQGIGQEVENSPMMCKFSFLRGSLRDACFLVVFFKVSPGGLELVGQLSWMCPPGRVCCVGCIVFPPKSLMLWTQCWRMFECGGYFSASGNISRKTGVDRIKVLIRLLALMLYPRMEFYLAWIQALHAAAALPWYNLFSTCL